MARRADAIADNTPGDFYVDSSCIDCDLCRQIAPSVFLRSERRAQSYVAHQPVDPADQHRALMALVTCPTSSIGTTRKLDARAAARSFPEHATGDIYFCGWASEHSYGAASWLVRRPAGNVLVDSPRASSTLFDQLAALGGVQLMVLTHRDDVADHAAVHARFGCDRVIHAADVSSDTRSCERIIDAETQLADDLLVIPVPGHTRGSIVLLHGSSLFSGDHLWANDAETGLDAGRDVCWFSWADQKRSVAKLAGYAFTDVFPGHGRRFHADSPGTMRRELERLVTAM